MAKQNPDQVDLSNPEQVRQRNQAAEGRAKRIENGLALVLSHADSRLWLFSMLEEANPFGEPFTGNSHTFYNCGSQAWAKRLISMMLDRHLDAYTRMMKENNPG